MLTKWPPKLQNKKVYFSDYFIKLIKKLNGWVPAIMTGGWFSGTQKGNTLQTLSCMNLEICCMYRQDCGTEIGREYHLHRPAPL